MTRNRLQGCWPACLRLFVGGNYLLTRGRGEARDFGYGNACLDRVGVLVWQAQSPLWSLHRNNKAGVR